MSGRPRRPRGWFDHLAARQRRLGRIVVMVALGIVISQWVRVILRPYGDFALHWNFGHRLIRGEFLYSNGMHTPYPPFWALASTPLTILPIPTIRALAYPFGLVPLVALLWMLHRLTRDHFPLPRTPRFWATVLALVLSSRFLIRELPDNGTNLTIVALSWAAVYLWVRGRDRLGGAALGLAIALKCTPALLVAYYAWKRQWRFVAWTTAAALAFTLSPALWMGPSSYALHMRTWIGNALKGLSVPNPMVGVLGDEELKNVSLRPGLARFLVHVPPDHKGYCDHPWHIDLLDLPPATAGVVVKVVMLVLLAGVAWSFRRPSRRDGLAVLWECAAVSILMLLFSPITWRQHCVGVIPAFYLIARQSVSRGGMPRWMIRALGVYVVLVLVLDRGVVGPSLTNLLDSYSVTTWGLMALLTVVLGCRARAAREDRSGAGAFFGRVDAEATAPRGPVGAAVPACQPAREAAP